MNEPAVDDASLVNRREAIRRVSTLFGGIAFVGGTALLAALEKPAVAAAAPPGRFTAENIVFLDEVAETILPATSTPGAKAAKTGAFMALMVTDSYSSAEQQIFFAGMHKVDEAAKKTSGAPFMAATPEQRLAVLTTLDAEQKRVMDARAEAKGPAHYFRMMKELALLGYFTSEIGCTKAQRYVESPGRFDPCIPYTPGEPAWASHA